MIQPKPRHRLNWRQILLQFIAVCLIALAFQQIAFLAINDKYTAIVILRDSGESKFLDFIREKEFTAGEAITYFFYAKSAWIIGLLVAFIMSLIISHRRHWYWVNSLMVLIAAFLLGRQDYWDWKYVKSFFLTPGLIFHGTFAYLFTNGVTLLGLGVFVLLFKKSNDFIEYKTLEK